MSHQLKITNQPLIALEIQPAGLEFAETDYTKKGIFEVQGAGIIKIKYLACFSR